MKKMDEQFFGIFPQFFVADALFYAADAQFNVILVYFCVEEIINQDLYFY